MIALSLVAILATPSLPVQRSVPLPPDFEMASIAIEDVHAFAPPEAAAAPATDSDPGEAEEIVVTASRHRANDPLRAVNAAAFALSEKVDDAILEPAAHVYEQAAPRPVRTGLRNFFANLREPVAFVNFLLQFKFGKAAETVGRFAINSTIGLAGVVDMARRCPFRLPRRPNGFSDTLGFYGVKQGPFLFLPLLGPTTLRDLVGGAVDGIASPVAIGGPFRNRAYIVISNVVRTLDRRVEMDEELREISEQPDPYAARRDRYLDQREARVRRLKGLGDPDAVVEETPYGQVDPSAPLPACPRRKASHAG